MQNPTLKAQYFSAKIGFLNGVGTMTRVMPHHKSVLAFVTAPYLTKEMWDVNRKKYADDLLRSIEKEIIGGLTAHVVTQFSAIPQTLERYTGNYLGAAYGWAGLPEQIALHDMRKPSSLDGLYLAGHWATQGIGIPGVIYSGYETAKLIMRRMNHG